MMAKLLMAELSKGYYRLALSSAARRDLSGAERLARYARLLDEQNENAAKLLEICRHELGGFMESADAIEQISIPVKQKKWREAARLLGSAPHQSVRVLYIRGCLHACAKQYWVAAQCFKEALEKDCGNQLAAKYLYSCTQKSAILHRPFCRYTTRKILEIKQLFLRLFTPSDGKNTR